MKKLHILILAISFLLPVSAEAAGVYLSLPANIIAGETFKAGVIIDTGGEMINSIDLSISYDETAMSFAGYASDNSLIQIWVEPPASENGKVSMLGVIPGGVAEAYDPRIPGSTTRMTLVELLFKAEKAGQAELSFEKSLILKNDGTGSELAHKSESARLAITDAPSQSKENEPADSAPPAGLTIDIIESPGIPRSAIMVAFEAKDPGSGIQKYEIRKGNGKWETAESPVLVTKSILPYALSIRAFDFNGNFEEGSLTIPGILSFKLLLILAGLLLGSIIIYKLISYRK